MGITRKKETEIYQLHHEFEPDHNGNFPAKIICKFDYFTCMYYGCSVSSLLDYYQLHKMMSKDLYQIYDDRYIRNGNTGSYLIFYLTKGVSIEIPIKHVFEKLGLVDATKMSFDDFLCFEFPSIRFNVTGDGLEHLRINNFDVEKRLFLPSFIFGTDGKKYFTGPKDCTCKITRLDVAYDFLNYGANIYDLMVECYMKHGNILNGTMFTGTDPNSKTPRNISIKSGKERTIYLGSNQSGKLLRVYDKMHQWNMCKRKNISKFPYMTSDGVIPDSWVRCELQLRDSSDEFLFTANGDFGRGLQYIFMNFAPCEEHNVVYKPFGDLFNWEFIALIIQNANCATPPPSISEKVASAILRNLKSLYLLHAYHSGTINDELRVTVNDVFLDLQRSESPESIRRVFNIKCYCLDDENQLPPFVEIGKDGLWHLTFV